MVKFVSSNKVSWFRELLVWGSRTLSGISSYRHCNFPGPQVRPNRQPSRLPPSTALGRRACTPQAMRKPAAPQLPKARSFALRVPQQRLALCGGPADERFRPFPSATPHTSAELCGNRGPGSLKEQERMFPGFPCPLKARIRNTRLFGLERGAPCPCVCAAWVFGPPLTACSMGSEYMSSWACQALTFEKRPGRTENGTPLILLSVASYLHYLRNHPDG